LAPATRPILYLTIPIKTGGDAGGARDGRVKDLKICGVYNVVAEGVGFEPT
jgi:hypothetical protein